MENHSAVCVVILRTGLERKTVTQDMFAVFRCITYLFLAASVLFVTDVKVGASTFESDYVNCVQSAVEALELGQTDVALAQLKVALKWDANDALAHTALGVCLLMGGRTKEAGAEFSASAMLSPERAEPSYGQGLVRLAEKRTAAAAELFRKAYSLEPRQETQEALSYALSPSGSDSQEASSDSPGEAGFAMRALVLTNQRRFEEAAPIWTELQNAARIQGFAERIGFSMSFLPERPLLIRGAPLKGSLDLPSSTDFKGPQVSGTVSLRADLSKVSEVKMVAFLVDNRLAGLTNEPPFQYMWDTTMVPNGQHTVKIIGSDASGCTISEKTTVVLVRNTVSQASSGVSRYDQTELYDRLWELIVLRPSVAGVNYNLAVCSLRTKDVNTARMALERVLAVDPDYRDARAQMTALCSGAQRLQSLHRIPTDTKAVALTFDDGPGPDTGRLLDILAEKGVKATFFVVG